MVKVVKNSGFAEPLFFLCQFVDGHLHRLWRCCSLRCRLFRLSAFPTDKPACRRYRPRYILRVNICHIPLTANSALTVVCFSVTHIAGTFFLNIGNTFLSVVVPHCLFTNAKTSSVSRKNFCLGLS